MTCYLYPLRCFKLKLSQTFTRTACLARQFLASFLFFLLPCRSWLSSDTHLKGFPFMSLPSYAGLWHLRDPLERERWQKDGWPRYFRTQLLLLPQSANTGLHKDAGGLCEGWEGKPLAQLLIWYSRLVRKGRWSSAPHPCTYSHTHTHTHTHTHSASFPPWHANTHTHTHTHTIGPCENYIPSRGCCIVPVLSSWLRVNDISAADSGVYTVTHPDPGYLLIVSVLTWNDTSMWLCPLR